MSRSIPGNPGDVKSFRNFPDRSGRTVAVVIAREEVSRRLKAARWLAGDVDANGKPRALPIADLAQREELVSNRVSANRLEEIEQMKTAARPVELREIARALEVPETWFDPDFHVAAGGAAEAALEEVRDHLDRIAADVYANSETLSGLLETLSEEALADAVRAALGDVAGDAGEDAPGPRRGRTGVAR